MCRSNFSHAFAVEDEPFCDADGGHGAIATWRCQHDPKCSNDVCAAHAHECIDCSEKLCADHVTYCECGSVLCGPCIEWWDEDRKRPLCRSCMQRAVDAEAAARELEETVLEELTLA